MTYLEDMRAKVDEVYDGIELYATQLEDLDGLVFNPIADMCFLTEENRDALPFDLDADVILEYLQEASNGAEHYAETLYDTTDCTEYLDRLIEYLGIPF